MHFVVVRAKYDSTTRSQFKNIERSHSFTGFFLTECGIYESIKCLNNPFYQQASQNLGTAMTFSDLRDGYNHDKKHF